MDFVPLAIFIFIITTQSERRFVSTASIPLMGEPHTEENVNDSNERELESLKDRLGKTLEMVKTQSSEYSRNNGETEIYSDKKETVNKNGKFVGSIQEQVTTKSNDFNERPIARIQTDVKIPSEGIHRSVVQDITPSRPKSLEKKMSEIDKFHKENEVQTITGIQYSPYDMAEYIFWTGDEKGVSAAIEEFINEGIMSRQDAITFLQDIKSNIDYLESRYNQLGLNLQEKIKMSDSLPMYRTNTKFEKESLPKAMYDSQDIDFQRLKKEERSNLRDDFNTFEGTAESKQNDYEQLLEKLKISDSLYTEYNLEEIIYQLAKIMFKQSLTKDNLEAQQALHKFILFLESEAEQGHISRPLEKKVLDVLIAALTDTLRQNPDLVEKQKEPTRNPYPEKQEVLQRILELNSETNINSVPTFKYPTDKSNYEDQTKSNLKYPPLGYGKYSSTS